MIGINDNHRVLYKNALIKAHAYGTTDRENFYDPDGRNLGLTLRTNSQGYVCCDDGTQIAGSYFVSKKCTIFVSLDNGNSWPISWVVDQSVDSDLVNDGSIRNLNGLRVFGANAENDYTLNYEDLSNRPRISLWAEAQQTETVTGDTTISVNMYTKVLVLNATASSVVNFALQGDTANVRYGQRFILALTSTSQPVTVVLGNGEAVNCRTLQAGYHIALYGYYCNGSLRVYPEDTANLCYSRTITENSTFVTEGGSVLVLTNNTGSLDVTLDVDRVLEGQGVRVMSPGNYPINIFVGTGLLATLNNTGGRYYTNDVTLTRISGTVMITSCNRIYTGYTKYSSDNTVTDLSSDQNVTISELSDPERLGVVNITIESMAATSGRTINLVTTGLYTSTALGSTVAVMVTNNSGNQQYIKFTINGETFYTSNNALGVPLANGTSVFGCFVFTGAGGQTTPVKMIQND